MTVVTLTDRPKSVRCVIEVLGAVFVLSQCFLEFSVSMRAFVIGLSQISSFFSKYPLLVCNLIFHDVSFSLSTI